MKLHKLFCMMIGILSICLITSCSSPDYVHYKEDSPPWLIEMKNHKGLTELPGKKVQKQIARGFELCGLSEDMWDDNGLGWCSAFLNYILIEKCGLKGTRNAKANSFLTYGARVGLKKGAIGIFKTGSQYHVAVIESWRKTDQGILITCWGGNQTNEVRPTEYPSKDLIDTRWPTTEQVL
ncbi:MAG: hypothetical protein OMM_00554 [Candidatus Magnetoglobus multicellularis str. Araruama]|uniref:Peptidase C51 domain-containing protein n=1 Tax=Candidatus Magnetoglobus multicellularis str. Araruama TaxID=890399 RepID=A0A1V1PGP8_9BACT|nr:MAG: hypothetical protein OMM_00554 [Candidatus Magnetoglobus multicellularis str. Araruama]